MNTVLINTVIYLIQKLDESGLLRTLAETLARMASAALAKQADRLVRWADKTGYAGSDKKALVIEKLQADDSPVRAAAQAAPQWLIDTVVQAAVAKLRIEQGKDE